MVLEIMSKMTEGFKKYFAREPERKFFSPGRVNLIGEHTDYNGGNVFPCAITLGTYAMVAMREDNISRVISLNLEDKGVIEFPMEGLVYDKSKDWANYLMGVVKMMADAGYEATHGFDILLYGTLPNGAGLSSSASIEVLMADILNDTFDFGLDMLELVKLSQKAENVFVGMNCGIMDQFAVGMGKENCAILLDCNTLEYRYSKLNLDGVSIVITNTNKKHSLNDSAYNERRSQCENALKQLQTKLDIKALGELTEAEFDANKNLIDSPVEQRRAHHAVYENQRAIKAVEALEAGDLAKFGELMHDSHVSLRDDYEVTCKELDTLAELAWAYEGVIGSRMTGGGFGGSTVSLIKNEAIDGFIEEVGKKYTEIIGYAPSFYVAGISDGAHKL